MLRAARLPNKTIVLVNQMVGNDDDGTQDEDVAVPHQLEPLFLNLPKGVRKQASVGAFNPQPTREE